MFSRDKTLKKISTFEYEEISDKNNLKWKKDLNTIALPLHKIKVITHLQTHKKDIDFKGEFKEIPEKQITSDLSTKIIISAQLDDDNFDDSIYCLEETDTNEEFKIVRPKGYTKVNLKVGKSTEDPDSNEHQAFNEGVYISHCFQLNFEPDEDNLIFELYLPEVQIQTIINRLKVDQNAKLTVYLELESCTNEVDDSLREPWHRRELVIEEHSNAFVVGVGVTSNIGNHTVVDLNSENEADDSYTDEAELSPEQLAHAQLIHTLKNLQQPLKNITAAIWVLTVIALVSILA